MRRYRFYFDELGTRQTGMSVQLDDRQAYHLSRVLRLYPGDRCVLFDGRGTEFVAEVVESKKRAVLKLIEPVEPEVVVPVDVTVAFAPSKGKKDREMMETLTHTGAARLIPMNTDHAVVDVMKRAPRKAKKYRRIVVEALKLCGRSYMPEVEEPGSFDDILERTESAALKLMPDPEAETPLHETLPSSRPEEIAVLIGPEGGFSDEERERAANHGYERVRIAPAVLPTHLAGPVVCSQIVLPYMDSGS